MAGNVKHAKTLSQPDGADGTKLQPSDYNAAHMAPAGLTEDFFLQATAGSADRQDWRREGRRLVNAPMRVLLINSSTALSNHTTLTAYDKLLTIPAGSLLDPARITFEAAGVYSTTGTPSITLQVSLNDGGALNPSINSGAIVTPSSVTNFHWSVRWSVTVRALGGAIAVALEMGQFQVQGTSVQAPVPPPAISDTADTSLAWQFSVLVGWSTPSSSNASTLRTGSIRVEPAGTLVS